MIVIFFYVCRDAVDVHNFEAKEEDFLRIIIIVHACMDQYIIYHDRLSSYNYALKHSLYFITLLLSWHS